MLNQRLINCFLNQVDKVRYIKYIKEVFNHLKLESDYSYERFVNRTIEILDGDKCYKSEDVKLEVVKQHINEFVSESNKDKIDLDSIEIIGVDNIDKTIHIKYSVSNEEYYYYGVKHFENIDYNIFIN